jgi:shikimate dehydrogenase
MRNSFYENTEVIGLIGQPVKQSYSPFIHNVAIELTKLNYIYLPFNVPSSNLGNALKGMNALGIKGFNVTIPHKVKILDYLNNLSEEAADTGAVNTVVNDHGKLTGYNTDVYGVLETLLPYKDEISGHRITVVGSGGAARAAIYVLIRYFKPSKIHLVNRTEQRAESLRVYFRDKLKFDSFKTHELFPPDLVDLFSKSKLIINATPIGMYPDIDDNITAIPESFNKNQIAFDLVYNPVKTKFLQLAQSRGAIVLDGITMLVYQAAKSFYLWTGVEMPVTDLNKSLRLLISR